MNPADEMAAKRETTELAGAVTGSAHKSDEQLLASLEAGLERRPVEDLHSLLLRISHHLDYEHSERKTNYHRLLAIDDRTKRAVEILTKRRASRTFFRYAVAIGIGVAGTLAWQSSYGEATKQIIATRAPELGWSPETKQMIANWVEQLGWMKPPATPENTAVRSSATETPQAAPVAQTAPAPVTPSVAVAPSIDPAEVHQIARDLTALRQTVAQITASQDQMARKVDILQAADQENLVKMPEPSPPPPIAAAPAVAERPAPGGAPSENTQKTAPTSASPALRASCGPDVQRLCRGISIENGDVIKCLTSHRKELSPTCDAYFNEVPMHRAAKPSPNR
jgi:cysteine rich repeat protein